MSPLLDTLRRPTSLAWVVTAAMAVAMLAVPVVPQQADAATPTCMGKKATIVGTRGADTLKGTARADVIVGLGGNDTIIGRGGNDRICGNGGSDTLIGGGGVDRVSGGGGNDQLVGLGGNDLLMGSNGNDVLRGGTGDDSIDGDGGIDRCYQDDGTGTLVECETADLAVTVSGPKRSRPGALPYVVTVTNNGPDAAPYTLTLKLATQRSSCQAVTWDGVHTGALLASGESRTLDVTADCTRNRKGAKVRVAATVATPALDPLTTNDVFAAQTNLR